MANQIGDFYETYPDQSYAQEGIADHLNKFWALPMRKQIAQYVNAHGGQGLSPQVKSAIEVHLQA